MSESEKEDLGVLKAKIDEVEPGLFKAEFIDTDREGLLGTLSLTDAHIGMDREGVIQWVEERAEEMGYSSVEWVA